MAKSITETEIRDAQQILGALGYYDGPVDGVLRPRFSIALSKYQQKEMGGPWRLTHKLGVLDIGTHANLVAQYAHGGVAYDAPDFEPVTEEEMDDAREGLLRTERLLEDG